VEGDPLPRLSRRYGYLELLCQELAGVTPAAARLVLLDGLAECAPFDADARLASRLRRLVPSVARAPANYGHLGEDDWPLMAIRDAEVDRVTGRPELARQTLSNLSATLAGDGEQGVATLPLVEAAVRAGAGDVVCEVAGRELARLGNRAAATLLDAVVLLRAAGAVSDRELRERLLARAGGILDGATAPVGRWRAVLYELLADQAEQAGRLDEAYQNRQLALAAYDKLDDVVGRDRLRSLHTV
jgi:hypothetical protein